MTVRITASAEKKPRHELKYNISPQEDLLLSQRLRSLFPHDTYAGSHGSYRVSSLYFDTPYDLALRQKIDGVNQREKFRLRHYNDDLSFIRLEKKSKRNGLCTKHSAPLSAEEVAQILQGDFEFLQQRDHPLLTEFYAKLKGLLLTPAALVVYDREPFLFAPGNVRITLDRNVRVGLSAAQFLSPAPHSIPISPTQTVLEVKYDEFLPDLVRDAVGVPDARVTAFSKYAVCRRYF